MSVLALLDFSVGEWVFDVSPETSSPDFQVGFANGSSPVEHFDRLAFGITIAANGLSVLTSTYPPEGVGYVATDQTYLTNDRVYLAPDDEVVLTVWAENGGQRYEGEVVFTAPRPEQPYPSWTWDDGAWTPPVPPPDFDQPYEWDENQQSWIAVDPTEEP